MINDLKKIRKVADILNCEGTILGLNHSGGKLYLSSHLKKGGGTLYYSTTKQALRQYLNSEITLKELYLKSDDLLVMRELRTEVTSHLKEDFAGEISCGENYYKEFINTYTVRKDIRELVAGI